MNLQVLPYFNICIHIDYRLWIQENLNDMMWGLQMVLLFLINLMALADMFCLFIGLKIISDSLFPCQCVDLGTFHILFHYWLGLEWGPSCYNCSYKYCFWKVLASQNVIYINVFHSCNYYKHKHQDHDVGSSIKKFC